MADVERLIRDHLTQHGRGVLGSQGYVLGFDLGSYGLRTALVDLGGSLVDLSHHERPNQPEAAVAAAVAAGRDLLARHGVSEQQLVRIGVGFPGPVDQHHGTVRLAPRLVGWENFPLQERIEEAFDAVTLIDNDANLIARAEASFGVGRGCQHLFYLHLSSGVGGGMVLDGRLYRGARSEAGEIGHAVVGLGWDGAGRPGTLEEHVSISGLLHRAAELGLSTDNLEQVFSDHPAGKQVVDETINLLATRVAQIVALLDPQMIVLGGIVVRIGGERFVEAIRERATGYIAPSFARELPIVASILGTESVVVGAVAMTLDSLVD